eukprot:366259-Chlamydomonas_euryale.AAC.8
MCHGMWLSPSKFSVPHGRNVLRIHAGDQECMLSCNDVSATDWKAVLDAMGRDAMDAGDEAVDLASDDSMAGAAEAEAMAAEKAF